MPSVFRDSTERNVATSESEREREDVEEGRERNNGRKYEYAGGRDTEDENGEEERIRG